MTAQTLTRRWVLAGLGAGLAAPSLATAQSGTTADLVAKANLTGTTGFCVADLAAGEILDSFQPNAQVPPASVIKAITALYALDRLGPDHHFTTQVLATDAVSAGTLAGDLILSGGGDPTLDTDSLGDMAAALASSGLRRVTGRFLVYADALPTFARISDDLPAEAGYDPGLSGLSLNNNRVNLEWTKGGATARMTSPGLRFLPEVKGIKLAVVDRDTPVFTYSDQGSESWTVSRAAMAKEGNRWLPVRHVAPYVAEVFATLCAMQGITLPAPQMISALPPATPLVTWPSASLSPILQEMLKYSTNITAETVGLGASGARSLPDSAGAMQDWAQETLGLSASFVDHSGLGAASRVTAKGMMRALMAGATRPSGAGLRALLKEVSLKDEKGAPQIDGPVKINAKSGTLNFVSGLSGFMTQPSGRELVFAIFSADPERREAVPVAEREKPPGQKAWTGRARVLQNGLLRRWATMA
ncbi:MAG: D-alanyl-D-alanine carboxypeptidase/D-alanyl-D-alanine-endopeptidase [Pseudomonadota bacterium]